MAGILPVFLDSLIRSERRMKALPSFGLSPGEDERTELGALFSTGFLSESALTAPSFLTTVGAGTLLRNSFGGDSLSMDYME